MRSSIRRLGLGLACLVTVLVVVSGCGVGPGISIEVADTPGKSACKAYASAFANNNSRETITSALQQAAATAINSGDADAKDIAELIDVVLTNTVMGTQQSLEAANQAVIARCIDEGVNITVTE